MTDILKNFLAKLEPCIAPYHRKMQDVNIVPLEAFCQAEDVNAVMQELKGFDRVMEVAKMNDPRGSRLHVVFTRKYSEDDETFFGNEKMPEATISLESLFL